MRTLLILLLLPGFVLADGVLSFSYKERDRKIAVDCNTDKREGKCIVLKYKNNKWIEVDSYHITNQEGILQGYKKSSAKRNATVYRGKNNGTVNK